MIDQNSLTTTFNIRRPYGAGASVESGLRCRLMEQLDEGRAALAGCMQWTHYIDCQETVDIRDGITRATGALTVTFTEADADEVRIPDDNGTRYIVVFVAVISQGDKQGVYKRVFLHRDDPVWTGTGWDH